jgi:hypothetical protein
MITSVERLRTIGEYALVAPITKRFAGKLGFFEKPEIQLLNNKQTGEIIETFINYDEILAYYCTSNGIINARVKLEQFELRLVADKKYIHDQTLCENEFEFIPKNKAQELSTNKLEFPITKEDFDKFLETGEIINKSYQKKLSFKSKVKNSFLGKIVRNFFDEDEATTKQNFSSIEEDQGFDPTVALNNTLSETQLIEEVSQQILQTPTVQRKTTKSRKQKRKKVNRLVKFLGISTFIASMFFGGTVLKSNLSKNNSQNITQSIEVIDTQSINRQKIAKYDNIVNSINPQEPTVCKNLVGGPNPSKYSGGVNSDWFKLDYQKAIACEIQGIHNTTRFINNDKINEYKIENSERVVAIFNR